MNHITGKGRKKALIISISDYGSKLQYLQFCRKDGEEMCQVLEKLGYQILPNHKLIGYATFEAIRQAIYDFFENDVRAEDTLLFYYSGHGIPDPYGDVFLASSEVDPERPHLRGFSFVDLTQSMNRSVSLRMVTILDCCYSGAAGISKGAGEEAAVNIGRTAISRKANILQQGEGKYLLAASQAAQEAFGLEEKGHSIFTYYLLEGLKGNKNSVDISGNITPHSLSSYVYNELMNLPKRPKQKPLTKGEISGDIILAQYPELANPNAQQIVAPSTNHKTRILVPLVVVSIIAIIFGINFIGLTNFPLDHHNQISNKNVTRTGDVFKRLYPSKPPLFDAAEGGGGRPRPTKPEGLTVHLNPITISSTGNITKGNINWGDGHSVNYTNLPEEFTPGYTVQGYPFTSQFPPETDPYWHQYGPHNFHSVSHTYARPGVYPITISAYDSDNQSNHTGYKVDLSIPNSSGIKVGPYPSVIEINEKNNLVYVYNEYKNGSISVINGTTNTLMDNIILHYKGLPRSADQFDRLPPVSISVNPNSNTIYVTAVSLGSDSEECYVEECKNTGYIRVIDGSTHNITKSFKFVVNGPILYAYVNPTASMIYALNGTLSGNVTLSIINGTSIVNDTASNIAKKFTIMGLTEGSPYAPYLHNPILVNPSTNMIYVKNISRTTVVNNLSVVKMRGPPQKSFLVMINGSSNEMINETPAEVIKYADPINIDIKTNQLYWDNDTGLLVLDGNTGKVNKTIPIPSKFQFLNVNAKWNVDPLSGTIYGIGVNDSIVMVDLTNDKASSIIAGWWPTSIGINQNLNRIYITNQFSNTTSVIDGKTDKLMNIPNTDLMRN